MINVSDAWLEAMQTGTRYYPTASLTLASGTVLSLAKGDFMIDNNGYTDGAGANALPVGAAICRTIRLELANADGRFTGTDFQDAVCRLSINVDLASGTEAVAVGVFTLGKPETFGETVIINGQDDMHKADRPYTTALTYPATALAVLQEACSACGITFTATSIPEGTFSIPEAPSTQLTFRSVIGYVAGLSGACARINRLGVLEVVAFDWSALAAQRAAQTASGIHDLTRYTEIQMELQDVTVTGVKAEIYDDETGGTSELLVGAEGYTLTIDNPLIAGQEQTALATIGAALIGAQFRILRLDHVAYPLAEFGDGCRITDKSGGYVYTVITDVDFTFHGFTVLTNSGEAPERAMATYTAPDTSALVKAAALVKSEKTAREAAVEALAQQLASSGGMYETTEAAAGGGTIYYLHDKPTLASSLVVLKLTAEALGISTDGGKTYPAGWDFVTGTTITNTLQAVGINADWINAGALTVTDADGNVLFKADATVKTVQIAEFTVSSAGLSYQHQDKDVVIQGLGIIAGWNTSAGRGETRLDPVGVDFRQKLSTAAASHSVLRFAVPASADLAPDRANVFYLDNIAEQYFQQSDGTPTKGVHIRTTFTEPVALNAGVYGELSVSGNISSSNNLSTTQDGAIGGDLQVGGSITMNGAKIVESGSNANGNWIKWADGTMICYLAQSRTDVAITSAYGSLFLGAVPWTFPQVFTATPVVTCSEFIWGTGASWGAAVSPSTSAVTLRVYDVSIRPAGTSTYVQAMAVGRWK